MAADGLSNLSFTYLSATVRADIIKLSSSSFNKHYTFTKQRLRADEFQIPPQTPSLERCASLYDTSRLLITS